LIIVLAALPHVLAKATPTEASLIEAWEAVQRNDPQTEIFEKIGDRRYRFKTRRFAFDGELKVLNAVIDARMAGATDGFVRGVIEYELVGLPADTEKKYHASYELWQENNDLYFDPQKAAWVGMADYRAHFFEKSGIREGQSQQPGTKTWVASLLTFSPIIIFVLAWMWLARRHDRRRLEQAREEFRNNREYLQRYNEHMEKVESLLERIAAKLDVGRSGDMPPAPAGSQAGGEQSS